MTGPEHFAEAERLLDALPGLSDCALIPEWIARAQVHATLATAAAFVDGPAVMRPGERDEWDRATGRLEVTPLCGPT